MEKIPISAAKEIAAKFGYDQVIIVARAVGEGEHVTTYGKDKANCDVAARIGEFLKFKVMGWLNENGKENSHNVKRVEKLEAALRAMEFEATAYMRLIKELADEALRGPR